jgi:hypothetical protein
MSEAQAEYLRQVCQAVAARLEREGQHLGAAAVAAHQADLDLLSKTPAAEIDHTHFERCSRVSDAIDGKLRQERIASEYSLEAKRQEEIAKEKARERAAIEAFQVAQRAANELDTIRAHEIALEKMKADVEIAKAQVAIAQAEAAKAQAEAEIAKAQASKAETDRLLKSERENFDEGLRKLEKAPE